VESQATLSGPCRTGGGKAAGERLEDMTHSRAAGPQNGGMSDELNLARTILEGRNYREVGDDELLERSRALLEAWMAGEVRMERPKVYDHYAMVLVALLRRLGEQQARLDELEARLGNTAG